MATPASEAPDDTARAGPHRLGPRLGAGRFGVVYEAEPGLVVKVFHAGYERDQGAFARYLAVARAAQGVPRVAPIVDAGTTAEGRLYVAQPRYRGVSLAQCFAAKTPVDARAALALLRALAESLDGLHARGIVHGYLRAASVFLAADDVGAVQPVLFDVGLSALLAESGLRTTNGSPAGRPFYVAPEQVREEPVDARTDVYAFGALAQELLTGEPPIVAGSPMALRLAHAQEPPRRASEVSPGLPVELDAPLAALLAKARDDRPASAGEGYAGLAAAAARAGLDIPAGAPELSLPSPLEVTPRADEEEPEPRVFVLPGEKQRRYLPKRRRKLPWSMLALLVGLLVLVYLLARAENPSPSRPPDASNP